MLLSERDQSMFSRYYGRLDLIDDDKFWDDVLKVYMNIDVIMPVVLDPLSVRIFTDNFNCPPNVCGECCSKYEYTYLSTKEYEAIANLSEMHKQILKEHVVEKDGKKNIYGPCPFLKDNTCQIYEVRPNTCFFFPIQVLKHSRVKIDGIEREMMSVRVRCAPAVKAIRAIFRQALSKGNLILLPNLNVVSKE